MSEPVTLSPLRMTVVAGIQSSQGCLHYDYPLGLCLVTAGRGTTIPLKEIFYQPDVMWLRLRRLDKLELSLQ